MAAQRGTPQQRSLERRSISAAIINFLIDGKLKSRELKKKVFITPLREIPANERYWRIHLDGREFNKFKPDEDLNLRDQ